LTFFRGNVQSFFASHDICRRTVIRTSIGGKCSVISSAVPDDENAGPSIVEPVAGRALPFSSPSGRDGSQRSGIEMGIDEAMPLQSQVTCRMSAESDDKLPPRQFAPQTAQAVSLPSRCSQPHPKPGCLSSTARRISVPCLEPQKGRTGISTGLEGMLPTEASQGP